MKKEYPLLVNGTWRMTSDIMEIRSPFDHQIVAKTCRADPELIEQTIQAAERAFSKTKILPMYEKYTKLRDIAEGIRNAKEDFARILCAETAKPIKTARQEVERAILTFTDAAEECKRLRGEQLPLDFDPSSHNRWAILRRFPIGPIVGISPFNFPLNLVAHKIAPALASGNSIILKPASQTPLSALRLAQVIHTTEWPAGALNVLPMDSKHAHLLVQDDRLKMLTFTGSPEIGWQLKNNAGQKRVTLELGGNGAVIIEKDADLDYASTRCVFGGFTQAGQNCISVQRIYLQHEIYDRFMDLFLPKVDALKTGDPTDEKTDVGPLIHGNEVKRIKQWLREAVKGGAKILCGGKSEENIFNPTVVVNADPDMKISCEEVFGPVVVIYKYLDIEEALEKVNDSKYGLQAGIFTNDVNNVFKAYETLDVGGVIAGDVPTYRIDPMPYGGTKSSGMGREGVRFAMEEMTEPKLLVLNY